jgi:NAD(P)-binding Rossmann-like domain
MNPSKILEISEVPGEAGLFVLGALDRRLTLTAQQIRALNLAFALRSTATASETIGVIGAGIGGLTLASALVRGGHKVVILERTHDILPLYTGATHRWIHPRALDWPGYESFGESAGLPIFNWLAADAGIVTRRWREEWRAIASHFGGRLNPILRTSDVDVQSSGDGFEVSWNQPSTPGKHTSVDRVVLCVGYGTDKPAGELAPLCDSYWTPEALHRPLDGIEVLVSGIGDGGLTDLFRATLEDFSPDGYLAAVFEPHLTPQIYDRLRDVESDLHESGRKVRQMVEFYEHLRLEPVIEQLSSRLRHDTRVTLNGQSAEMFLPAASALNRLILSQLRHVPNAFSYSRGMVESPANNRDGSWTIHIGGRPRKFDRIVIRHGPHSELSRSFPRHAQGIDKLRGELSRAYRDDPLRTPQWPQGFFDFRDEDLKLERVINRSTSHVQPPDRGEPYDGGPLFLQFDDVFVELPAVAISSLVFIDKAGRQRHLKYSPVTRRRLRRMADLPENANIYRSSRPDDI